MFCKSILRSLAIPPFQFSTLLPEVAKRGVTPCAKFRTPDWLRVFLPRLSIFYEAVSSKKLPKLRKPHLKVPQPEALPPVKALKAPPSFKDSSMTMLSFNSKPTAPSKLVSLAVTLFSLADLQSATNSFSPEALVGEGSLGHVYQAEFANGQVLAVKKIDRFNASLVENEAEFLGVVQGLAWLQHANAVELVGYWVEHEQRLLVFQFVGRGNLHDLLHYDASAEKKGNLSMLMWNMRIKIALGAARALE